MIYFLCFFSIPILYFLFVKSNVKNSELKYCIIISVILILLSGLRGLSIGSDTVQYYWAYNDKVPKHLSDFLLLDWTKLSVEPGFYFLAFVCKNLGMSYQFFIILIDIFFVSSASFVIYKYSKLKWMSYIAFYSLPLFPCLSMSAERQALGFSFLMIAIHYIMKKKLLPYLVCIICAMLCHVSSLIFAPMYIYNWFNFKKRTLLIGCVILVVFFSFSYQILSFLALYQRQEGLYMDKGNEGGGYGFFALEFFFLLIAIWKYKIVLANRNILISLFIFCSTIFLFPLTAHNPALHRLNYSFDFLLALFFPNLLYQLRQESFSKFLSLIFIITMFICLWQLVHQVAYYPYLFFWEER